MEDIVFNKEEKIFKARFGIESATAIHLERAYSGIFSIAQSHVPDGKFARIDEVNSDWSRHKIIDFVIVDEVYPVYIEITSASPISVAKKSSN